MGGLIGLLRGGGGRRLDILSSVRARCAKANMVFHVQTASIADWAETTSEAAYGSPQRQGAIDGDPDAQDQMSYELSQQPLEGEVGDRDGAPVSQAGGAPPAIKREKGKGKESQGQRPLDPKAARKEAKKARRKAEKSANSQAKG